MFSFYLRTLELIFRGLSLADPSGAPIQSIPKSVSWYPQSCGKHTYVESATVSLTALKWSSTSSKLQSTSVSLSHLVCWGCLWVPSCTICLTSVCRWAAVQSQTGKWSHTSIGRGGRGKKEYLFLFAMTRGRIPTPQRGHTLPCRIQLISIGSPLSSAGGRRNLV